MTETKKPKCPVCESAMILHRKTDDKYRCRRCGMEWLRGEEDKIRERQNAKNQ